MARARRFGIVMTLGLAPWSFACGESKVAPGRTCGRGTVERDGVCVRELAVVATTTPPACGSGTVERSGQCVPVVAMDEGTLPTSCGAGTHLEGGRCVLTPVDAGPSLTCGLGTRRVGDLCERVAPAYFDVLSVVTDISGDGVSRVPIRVVGHGPAGGPAGDDVVLSLSRAGAGQLSASTLSLGPSGAAEVTLLPCSTAAAGCAGPFRVRVALASDPLTVLAESRELVVSPPAGRIGSPAMCLGHANALYLESTSGYFAGGKLVTDGAFVVAATGLTPKLLELRWRSRGYFERLAQHFRVWGSDAEPMVGAGVFEGIGATYSAYQEGPGVTFPSFAADGRDCSVTSRVEVHRVAYAPPLGVDELIASFEQRCTTSPGDVTRGCVRYTR